MTLVLLIFVAVVFVVNSFIASKAPVTPAKLRPLARLSFGLWTIVLVVLLLVALQRLILIVEKIS